MTSHQAHVRVPCCLIVTPSSCVLVLTTGGVRLSAWGPDIGSLQSFLHSDPSRLWHEETTAAQQPGLHSGMKNCLFCLKTESFQTNAAPSPLLRPRFRCWTTCWTLRWRTACWEEGPRTTRTTPSTSTMKNSKPLLRWAADDWVVVVRGDACVFDLPVCCPAGHRHVCQGGWHYSAVCQEHPRCHTQHLHTGSARSKHSGSIGPFFFFPCEFLLTLNAFPDFFFNL